MDALELYHQIARVILARLDPPNFAAGFFRSATLGDANRCLRRVAEGSQFACACGDASARRPVDNPRSTFILAASVGGAFHLGITDVDARNPNLWHAFPVLWYPGVTERGFPADDVSRRPENWGLWARSPEVFRIYEPELDAILECSDPAEVTR